MQTKYYCVLTMVGLFAPIALYAQPVQSPTATTPNVAAVSVLSVGDLSLARALELAASNNPLIGQSTANMAGAEAKLRSARMLQNPTLSLAHWAGRDTGGLDEDIILTQVIELGGKRAYRTRTASAELTAAQYEQISTALDLRLSVQTAYYETLRAQEEYNLAADSLARAKQFADATQTQFQAGDVPRSNVLRSEIELSRAQQDISTAQMERDNRFAALRSLIGGARVNITSLTDKLAFSPTSYSLADLETRALSDRPDIKAAQATRASLVAAAGTARAEGRPDLFIEGRRASINPADEGTSIRAGVIFTPFDLGRQRADVAAAQAAVTEQDAKIAEEERIARLEIETDYRNLEQARTTVQSFQTGRLVHAKELYNMAQIGYEKGANTYLEVLDAQNVYRNEQTDYARALATYNIALATLERAVGSKLP